ncbi:cytoglobin-1-like [Erpetoichthys calabaricus]|uniref:superoxide dismutase n=1 Tax=Erpetoichthys calabaricus TaxID=27687 RepID=A0A8C4T9R2_ERPCA|nr:cytoglobin-1-like [Erpetoichthys calabaricus]XP_039631587.1 cytoglobin-1-like [Polypterus senegalus]
MVNLTQEDKQNIRTIWAVVFQEPEENGKAVVIRLFQDHPETKKYFNNFQDINTKEEMEQNVRIRLHGKRVMGALNQVIESLDNWEAVPGILTPLATRHKNVHQVGVHNFKLLFEVILNVFQEALGPAFTPQVCESWRKVFELIFSFLEAFYKKNVDP